MTVKQNEHGLTRVANGLFVRRVLVIVAIVAALLAAAAVVVHAVGVLLLLFAGGLFARFLGGLSRALAKRTKLPYKASLSVVAVALCALVVGTIAYLTPQLTHQLALLTDELSAASKDFYDTLRQNEFMGKAFETAQRPNTWLATDFNAMAAVGGIFSTAAGAATGLAVILFVGLYMAVDPSLYTDGLLTLVPPDRRSRAREVFQAVGDTIWWWILGRLASMAIIGVVIALGLWILGIPVPFALGLLAALLTFIPNFGPLIALIPPTLLALRVGPFMALGVVAFYLLVQIVESYVITPLIQQRGVALPPVITISSQIILGVFTGILGLALATPLAAVGMVLVRELYVRDVLGDQNADTSPGHGANPPSPGDS